MATATLELTATGWTQVKVCDPVQQAAELAYKHGELRRELGKPMGKYFQKSVQSYYEAGWKGKEMLGVDIQGSRGSGRDKHENAA